jgi:hypothetical protein
MTASLSVNERPVPARARPFHKAARRQPAWMKLVVGRDMSPTEPEWQAMVDALWEGDEPMDRLVDWMFAGNPREARVLMERAINEGIASVPEAPAALRDFFAIIEREPEWLDRKLLEEGVSFIHRTGLAGPYVLRDFALMGGYLLSGFNKALILTGALNKSAAQRIAETGKWWIDCTEHGGMERFGDGFKSTFHVRMVHAMVRRHLPKNPEWDNAKDGLPVNQIDMVATYLAFGPVMLVGMRALGIPVLPHDSKAVMHLWKYVGWLMGVQEKWLVDDERAGLVRLYQTYMTQSRPDWTSKELGVALSKEPFGRTLPEWEKWPLLHELRLKSIYQQHLSVTSLFFGKGQRRQLGLPEKVYPWFPLLTAGPRFVNYSVKSLFPGMRERLETEGRAEQVRALSSMFGKKEHGIIKPGENHPAHIREAAK